MTLQELYGMIDGNYTQAVNVLRLDKLIDKHIKKLPENGVVDAVIEAGKTMNPTLLFEASHAMKGVCANLGLTSLAEAATVISEEFRPGNARTLSDAQVVDKINEIDSLYKKAKDGIKKYAESAQ